MERVRFMDKFNLQSSIRTGDDSIEIGFSRNGAISGAAIGSFLGGKIAGNVGAAAGYVVGGMVGAFFGPADS